VDNGDDFQEQLDEMYWSTALGTRDIALKLGVRDPSVCQGIWRLATPQAAPGRCERCAAPVLYTSRASRTQDRRDCASCGHRNSPCDCDCPACIRDRINAARAEASRKAAEEAREAEEAAAAYEHWRSVLDTPEQAAFALRGLSPASRGFYHALVDLLATQDSVSWAQVAEEAHVQRFEEHKHALVVAGLICVNPATQTFEVNTHGAIAPTPAIEDDSWSLYWLLEEMDAGEVPDEEVWEHCVDKMPALASIKSSLAAAARSVDYCDRDVWWRGTDGAGSIVSQVDEALPALPASVAPLDAIRDALVRHLQAGMARCKVHNDHPPLAIEKPLSDWLDDQEGLDAG